MNVPPFDITSKAPKCMISHFYCDNSVCTNFYTVNTSQVVTEEEYDWSVRLQCSICNKVWWLCNECPLRKKLLFSNQLLNHQYRYHVIDDEKTKTCKRVRSDDNECSFDDTNNDVIFSNNNERESPTNIPINVSFSISKTAINIKNKTNLDNETLFNIETTNDTNVVLDLVRTTMIDILEANNEIIITNSKTTEYYAYDIISCGMKYLISKMWSNENSNVSDIFKNISNSEVQCQMQLSSFCQSLSRNQNEDFAALLKCMQGVYFKNKKNVICKLPTSYKEIRRQYIDGAESIVNNLPTPNVVQLLNHSYVSVIHCVADFLYANKHHLTLLDEHIEAREFIDSMTIFGTGRVKQIIDEAEVRRNKMNVSVDTNIVLLFFKIWSDDFDPNNSIKSNRQSVWVKTLTIFARLLDGTKISYTYPISTGKKGVCHDEIDKLVSNEIEQLRTNQFRTFFCRFLLKPVFVHGDIFCMLADQPERRTLLKLSAGNSINHKRFGYLLDYSQCVDVIRACSSCQALVRQEMANYVHACNKILTSESLLKMKNLCKTCSNWMMIEDHPLLMYEADNSYPKNKLCVNGKLKLRKILRCNLEECVEETYFHLTRKKWTVNVAKIYLKTEGFHQKAIDEIIIATETEEIGKWKLPYSWMYFEDVFCYVDVPMHLLLLGVVKSVCIRISRWLKHIMRSPEFKELTRGVLLQLKKYNVEWCKILNYPLGPTDKFGGWVAENFLAFTRISNWFYSLLFQLKKKRDLSILDKPIDKWKGNENKLWLEIRGLSIKGKANELKERVLNYLTLDIIPPIITTTSESIDDVLSLISDLTNMIGMIMSKNTLYEEIDYIELMIRKFLNNYDNVDSLVRKPNDNPSWMTQYNFLTLLNVPNIMRKYGCNRNIWEGGIEGEGFLRKYKSELKNGIKQNWQIWSINNLLQRNVFQKEHLEKNISWKQNLSLECRVYKTYKLLCTTINDGKAISAIYINKKEKIYSCFRLNNNIYGILLLIDWYDYEFYCNMKYYKIAISNTTKICIDELIVNESTGCLLLPRLNRRDDDALSYCIVYSDWRKQ